MNYNFKKIIIRQANYKICCICFRRMPIEYFKNDGKNKCLLCVRK